MKNWILATLMAGVWAFTLCALTTLGTSAEGIHTWIGVGIIVFLIFAWFVWGFKNLLDSFK